MIPANFEQANHVFGPPSGYDESQVQRRLQETFGF